MPSSDLVDAYLGEIAKGYNVDWLPPKRGTQEAKSEGGVTVSRVMSRSAVQNGPIRPQEPTLNPKDQGEHNVTTEVISNVPPDRTPPIKDDPPKYDISKQPGQQDDFEALTTRFAALKKR